MLLSPSYLFGLLLLLCVIILWVLSSIITQYTFQNLDFNNPFFLTYFSTALFIIYLPIIIVKHFMIRILEKYEMNACFKKNVCDIELTDHLNYKSVNTNIMPLNIDNSESSTGSFDANIHTIDDNLLDNKNDISISDELEESDITRSKRIDSAISSNLDKSFQDNSLSTIDILKLSSRFALIWFSQNLLYNWSLNYTSVSSNTILSSTSSFFTLILSILLLKMRPGLFDFLAVLLTIGGVVLIGLQDNKPSTLLGDLLSILSALVYGCYTTLMKLYLSEDSEVDMMLFFGGIGLFNFVVLWPFFFIFNATGIEVFRWPSMDVLAALSINGIISAFSDYLWARAILLTSPLLATISLSLTIPGAMLYDTLARGKEFSFLYFSGSLLIILGFCFVNYSFQKNEEAKRLEVEQRQAEVSVDNI